MTKKQEISFHFYVDHRTIIICQHITPVNIDSTTSIANASLRERIVLFACQHTFKVGFNKKQKAIRFKAYMGIINLTEKSLSLSVSRSLFSA